MKKTIEGKYDVIVVGGGLSGVMAAVSASREGLNVLLIEKYGFLGGMATAGLVYPFMSYYENGGKAVANAGLFTELLKKIYELGGSTAPDSRYYLQEHMKLVLDRICNEYKIKVLFHSLLSNVSVTDGLVNNITISTISGNIDLKASFYIDATGNGDLFAACGMDFDLGRKEDGLCQPMTLNFRLANVDTKLFSKTEANELYKKMQAEGKIKNPRENILVFNYPDDNILHFNTTRIIGINPLDVEERSRAEMELREQVYEMYNFLKDNINGMQNAALIESGTESGIRESRRVKGRYTLTEEDVVGMRKFDDSIARGTYMIDIHNPSGTGTYCQRLEKDDYYTIPYRCLTPINSKNLLVVGRPISADHVAHSSLRIMPITTCIGEAAGIAASIACKDNCNVAEVSIEKLKQKLTSHGALV